MKLIFLRHPMTLPLLAHVVPNVAQYLSQFKQAVVFSEYIKARALPKYSDIRPIRVGQINVFRFQFWSVNGLTTIRTPNRPRVRTRSSCLQAYLQRPIHAINVIGLSDFSHMGHNVYSDF